MKRNLVLTAMLAAAFAAPVALPAHATSVTNTPIAGTITYWGPSTVGGGQSYGLVFTAPQGRLNDFSLTVEDDGTSFPFVSQVYAWNGTNTTGSALFTSGVDNTTSSLMTYTWTPNINVTPGQSYIAFVTNQPGPSGTPLGGTGTGEMQQGTGPATFMFAVGNPSAPGAWFPFDLNASFNADFSAVPEPATWAFMLLGLGGIGAAFRRSRHKTGMAFTVA